MDRRIEGLGSAEFLWMRKQVDPFLKIDQGLEPERDGARTMRPIPRVAALSGGYSRGEATAKLSLNEGVIASFSRTLTEAPDVQMDDEGFDAALEASIASIYDASRT